MSALNARTCQYPPASRGRSDSFCPETLEQRALLSVSLDLSLQHAFFNPPNSGSQSAVVAPFRIDASRVSLPPAAGAGRIDGPPVSISQSRIDGLPGGHGVISSTDVVLYQQIDYSKTRPFEKPSVDHPSLKAGQPAEPIPSDASPDGTVDWSRFDVFNNVSFTFVGGQITAELPLDGTGRTLDIRILVNGASLGITQLSGFRTGHGIFYARAGSLAEWTAVKPLPQGANDPLSIEPYRPGQEAPYTPNDGSAPPPTRPDVGSPPLPVPGVPQQPAVPAQPPQPELPPAARGDAPVQYVQTYTPATRLGLSDRDTQVITLTAGDAPVVSNVQPFTASRLATSQTLRASTTLLLDVSSSDGSTGSAVQEAARYLVVVGSTQLSSLASAAAQLFGQATPPSNEGTGEADVESSNLDMSGVLLGLSPWRMAGDQGQNAGRYAWGITAGVSLVIAVGGYWYCQEYVTRQRQFAKARSQPSQFPIKAVSRRNREELA